MEVAGDAYALLDTPAQIAMWHDPILSASQNLPIIPDALFWMK
jgi:hypothetical protein